jgi:phytoene dehydrogenase-like protein
MTDGPFDAIVIGAGVNGLTAAAALARAGRRILVVEASDSIGGQAQTIELAPGFLAPLDCDTGWLPPSVAKGLGVSVASVEPSSAVAAAHDGDVFTVPTDPRAASAAISKHSSRDAARWPDLAQRMRKLAGFLEALYQAPPPDVAAASISDFASLIGLGRRFRALGREDMTELLRVLPMSVQDFLDDELETPWLRAAVGAGGIRDIRQGPRSGGTSFILLHYLTGAPAGSVRARSWWQDGPDAFVRAAEASARAAGASIRTGAPVSRITVDDDAVTGVALASGEEIAAPVVLSTADPATTLLGLVDPVWLDPELVRGVDNIKFRACTAFVQFAVERLPSGVDQAALAGIVSLSSSLDAIERAYDAAKYGTVSTDPHVELSSPTLRWPSLAPSGKHILSARVQYVPRAPRDDPWSISRSHDLANQVTAMISRTFPGFGDSVLHRAVYTASDIASRFGLTDGARTHGELTLDQILFMRPTPDLGRFRTPIDGLYLAGAGSHPGPGVVGGAGWLAARAALAQGTKVRA